MVAATRDAIPALERLRITEIFASLQGEADTVGWPTVFVRLTGCPLRCTYCDTAYAFYNGNWWSIDSVVEEVRRLGVRRVCVTGGEPLAQPNAFTLLTRLCDAGLSVSLETSGALAADAVDARVVRVFDVKTPDSGESARNHLANLTSLRSHDLVKFVIGSRADYDWSNAFVREHGLDARVQVLYSPVYGRLAPRELAEWIVADRLAVRFQLQMHKVLWGEESGR